jgi:hypothetical protein
MENPMNKANCRVKRLKIKLLMVLLAALTGCAVYGVRGYGGGAVIVPEPDEYLFGGVYYDGRDAHGYSHRGHESRDAAHSSKKEREGRR